MHRVAVLARSFVIAVFLCLGCGAAGAQPDSLTAPPRSRGSIVVLPYAYYSPETNVAFGGGGIYSFRTRGSLPGGRPSSVKVAATYTLRNQVILALQPELYLRKERYYYYGFYGYYRYPDKFWGIGSETLETDEENFRSNDFESSTTVQTQIAWGISVGGIYEYQYLSVNDMDPRRALEDLTIPGSRGGSSSGLGFVIRYDTRDHVYQPSKGFYNQFSAEWFGPSLGSDYAFSMMTVDLRMYRAAFRSHVLAFQTYNIFIDGDAPFQMLSCLGGSYSMRGYYLGRFRDRNMITAQIEYRAPVWWRFGVVAFAGIGDVAGELRDFHLDRLKTSVGVGARFMFDPKERINARLDLGFGNERNMGIYAMVLEAF